MDDDRPRDLTADERDVLESALRQDFPGVAELRVQAASVRATRGCDCGCGTVALHVPGDLPPAAVTARVPVEGEVLGADGMPAGGLLLFVDDGRLSSLEVFAFGDEPLPMPPPDRADWGVAGRP